MLAPVVPPTPPVAIPAPNQLDEDTGMHITGHAQEIDLATFRLRVTGQVARPLELTYDELRCLPKVVQRLVLVCPGVFTDSAQWAGIPISEVLALAEPTPDAAVIRLVSADGYTVSVPLEDALLPENFLAYEWEGEPLPYLHGFPLRAVFPAKAGSAWLKWLIEIRVE